MSLIVVSDERCAWHFAGPHHPERAARLDAVTAGLSDVGEPEAFEFLHPAEASDAELERVHTPNHVAMMTAFCRSGGGSLDPDTSVVPGSLQAARLAAGAGLAAVHALGEGRGTLALCAVRPPGHHARPDRAMGFCVFNNVAVTAASLAEAGARVLIVDVDVHHGNGTQEIFWDDPRVAYASIHQWPWYPGTGAASETGGTGAPRGVLNVPVPAGATGDVYAAAVDELIVPFAERFEPDWLCVSLGFDAHRGDPLAEVALSAGDFAAAVASLVRLVPQGRSVMLLEGGYDLAAIRSSTAAVVGALVGAAGQPDAGERPTSGGPGRGDVANVASLWDF